MQSVPHNPADNTRYKQAKQTVTQALNSDLINNPHSQVAKKEFSKLLFNVLLLRACLEALREQLEIGLRNILGSKKVVTESDAGTIKYAAKEAEIAQSLPINPASDNSGKLDLWLYEVNHILELLNKCLKELTSSNKTLNNLIANQVVSQIVLNSFNSIVKHTVRTGQNTQILDKLSSWHALSIQAQQNQQVPPLMSDYVEPAELKEIFPELRLMDFDSQLSEDFEPSKQEPKDILAQQLLANSAKLEREILGAGLNKEQLAQLKKVVAKPAAPKLELNSSSSTYPMVSAIPFVERESLYSGFAQDLHLRTVAMQALMNKRFALQLDLNQLRSVSHSVEPEVVISAFESVLQQYALQAELQGLKRQASSRIDLRTLDFKKSSFDGFRRSDDPEQLIKSIKAALGEVKHASPEQPLDPYPYQAVRGRISR